MATKKTTYRKGGVRNNSQNVSMELEIGKLSGYRVKFFF